MNFDVKKMKLFGKNKIWKYLEEKNMRFPIFLQKIEKNEKSENLKFWKVRLFRLEKIMHFRQKVYFSNFDFQWFFNMFRKFFDFSKILRFFLNIYFRVDDFKWTYLEIYQAVFKKIWCFEKLRISSFIWARCRGVSRGSILFIKNGLFALWNYRPPLKISFGFAWITSSQSFSDDF